MLEIRVTQDPGEIWIIEEIGSHITMDAYKSKEDAEADLPEWQKTIDKWNEEKIA